MMTVKNQNQIALMRKAGIIVRDTLQLLEEHAKIGVTTKYLDELAYEYIRKQNAHPSFLGFRGFPGSICASIDNEVVHGVPSKKVRLEEGMLLKIDAGACFEGYHADAARTIAIGAVSPEKKKLMDVCKESFFEGMKVLKEGARLGDLGNAIQRYVEARGFSVVRNLIGHGIGNELHEDPAVPNYGVPGRGMRVFANMTIAVEPMINMGDKEVIFTENNVAVTKDGSPSAHYENTVVILPDGVEILTL